LNETGIMKQREVATLPPLQVPSANAESEAKSPGHARISPVERASTGAGKSDLLIPAAESMPMPRGSAMKKAMLDLLEERVEQHPAQQGKENDSALEGRPKRGIRTRTLPWWQLREREQVADLEHELQIRASEPGAASSLLMLPDTAPMAGSCLSDKVGIDPKDKSRRPSQAQQDAGLSDGDTLPESGDRLHRVAVAAHTLTHELRPAKMERRSSLPALRPKSKAECERRCGSDGFCDPSDPLGCGGLHCGQQRDVLY
jgi:hypothetical protein